ncbi:hypothetical protein HHK36_032650 [Tetracentron sinense]|uniref:Uncharacterized protein n=1 Tax=Tetracentron sinense TaxID=13715 RepID=A0A834Y6Q4_TETSI|nr:hypothetical protein HHK36_032650 [Tetracentron sinense]
MYFAFDSYADGLLMEQPSASFVSNKSTKMANTVTLVHTPKEYVRCAVSKYLTPRITSRATYNGKCYALACEDGVLLFVALGSVNWCNQIFF